MVLAETMVAAVVVVADAQVAGRRMMAELISSLAVADGAVLYRDFSTNPSETLNRYNRHIADRYNGQPSLPLDPNTSLS